MWPSRKCNLLDILWTHWWHEIWFWLHSLMNVINIFNAIQIVQYFVSVIWPSHWPKKPGYIQQCIRVYVKDNYQNLQSCSLNLEAHAISYNYLKRFKGNKYSYFGRNQPVSGLELSYDLIHAGSAIIRQWCWVEFYPASIMVEHGMWLVMACELAAVVLITYNDQHCNFSSIRDIWNRDMPRKMKYQSLIFRRGVGWKSIGDAGWK